MRTDTPPEHRTDVVIIGFGAAGACAAIEAHDAGARVILIEKQPEARHYSNSRMKRRWFSQPQHGG